MPSVPTSADRVLHRGLVMALMSLRFSIDYGAQSRPVLDSEDMYIVTRLNHLFNSSLELRGAITPGERKLLDLNIGEWSQDIMVLISWHSEAAGCLLWSVGEIKDFPAFDQPFGFDVFNKYFKGFTSLNWVIPFSKKHVNFRDKEEILEMKKRAELVFQRCLFAGEVRHKNRHIPLCPYDSLFRFSEFELPVGPSGDLLVFNQEFCDLSDLQEKTLFPVAASRVQAFSFVTNPNQLWDEITLDHLHKLPG